MCNRYRTAKDIERLRTIFADAPEEWFENTDSKYDTFYPKSKVPVVLMVKGEKMFNNFEWGITPSWAKTASMRLTNTKSEEVFSKPTWINSFRTRRCLMPATGFYEPATVDGKKFQMLFELKDESPFSFAGVWEKSDKFGVPRNTCSLLTCEPNSLVGEVHGRMPLILHASQYDTYLNTPSEQVESLKELFVPFPSEELKGRVDQTST